MTDIYITWEVKYLNSKVVTIQISHLGLYFKFSVYVIKIYLYWVLIMCQILFLALFYTLFQLYILNNSISINTPFYIWRNWFSRMWLPSFTPSNKWQKPDFKPLLSNFKTRFLTVILSFLPQTVKCPDFCFRKYCHHNSHMCCKLPQIIFSKKH